MINRFEDEFRFLSNFFVEPDGTTVEHEYQACKTVDVDQKREILAARSPGVAKRLGRKVTLRPEWDIIKVDLMRALVTKKFLEWPELRVRLAATGNEQLIEGNHWHDNEWGDCTCERCRHIVGRNRLGKILMRTRARLL